MGGIWEMNAWELMAAGGPIMIPILICSFFALGIVIEKLVYFSSIRTDAADLKKNIFELLKNNNIKEAVQLCDQHRSPVAKILRAGLIKYGSSRENIKESIEGVSLMEIPKLESRLSALGTIAHISPLLGLLGTVIGLTSCFHIIHVRAASLNPVTPGDLAGSIMEALLTTVAGLMVAIPAFVTYNYFVNRIDHYILEMERSATELVNFMCQITESGT